MTLFKSLLLSTLLLLGIGAIAQDDCMPKTSDRLVNDYAQILQPDQAESTGNQAPPIQQGDLQPDCGVITNELCNREPMEYATEIGHSWGVGQKEFDNGVVLLVSPEQRETFIAVGYGLEGAIPDAIAKRIVTNELLPHFREGDYYGGIDAATGVLSQLAKGEISAEGYGQQQKKGDRPGGAIVFIILLGIIFMVVGPMLSARKYANTNDVAFWTALMLIMSSRSSHGGAFGNFSSGSGSFGGGGGGFGGFGGGGFGGGGAGGSW